MCVCVCVIIVFTENTPDDAADNGNESQDKLSSVEKGKQLAEGSRKRRVKGRNRGAILLTSGEQQLLEWALRSSGLRASSC